MITRDKLVEIGTFNKVHGINGELSASFIYDIEDVSTLSCIILDVDGIYVPFFVDNYRLKNYHTSLLKLDGIDSEVLAKPFINKKIFALKEEFSNIEADENEAAYYIGFTIYDKVSNVKGEITGIDSSTENYLFIVNVDGQECLIPITTDFIEEISDDKKEIIMALPEGILSL